MPASRRTQWIVCYDIANPRRLVRVHRTMKRFGVPVQYSVFLVESTRKGLAAFLNAAVCPHIDPREDDLRAYPLLSEARPTAFGRGSLPDGVSVLSKWDVLLRPSAKSPREPDACSTRP